MKKRSNVNKLFVRRLWFQWECFLVQKCIKYHLQKNPFQGSILFGRVDWNSKSSILLRMLDFVSHHKIRRSSHYQITRPQTNLSLKCMTSFMDWFLWVPWPMATSINPRKTIGQSDDCVHKEKTTDLGNSLIFEYSHAPWAQNNTIYHEINHLELFSSLMCWLYHNCLEKRKIWTNQ